MAEFREKTDIMNEKKNEKNAKSFSLDQKKKSDDKENDTDEEVDLDDVDLDGEAEEEKFDETKEK